MSGLASEREAESEVDVQIIYQRSVHAHTAWARAGPYFYCFPESLRGFSPWRRRW